jgi:mono/diheme cytochrome c family protein
MKISERLPMIIVVLVLAGGIAVFVSQLTGTGSSDASVSVAVPELSGHAAEGKVAFDTNCGACHGEDASGGAKGPPLVHDIYNPGHHADAAFLFAARRGVRQHHWRFGDMPAQPQVSEDEIAAITQYVRELQQANGIRYRKHRM